MSDLSELMTMQDLRERYRTGSRPASRSFVYSSEQAGHLPKSVLVGGKRFWRRADVVALEASRFAEAQIANI